MAFPILPWVRSTNVYEVNIRQYTREGSFAAFIPHMQRLRDMGVETLWFMPITPISTYKRKGALGSYYACADYTAVNPEFGTLQAFKELVGYAHELGMKVIIDWVANHTGADHHWTQANPDYYIKNEQGAFYDKHGWDDVIDLNYDNREMREAMIQCMEFWISECDIDGFRCDMAMLVPVDFWIEARTYLDRIKPLFWLAECDQWNDPVYMEAFDAAYTWKWMHATEEHYKTGVPMHRLHDILFQYERQNPDAIRAWFTSNHDENSWNGTEYEKYGALALPLTVFSCTWNGIPLIYSGQELPNHKRLAFFDRDPIEWNDFPKWHDLYKRLLKLHKEHPALNASDKFVSTQLLHTEHPDKVLCFVRQSGEKEVFVLLNFSGWPLSVRMYDEWSPEGKEEVFGLPYREGVFELPEYGFCIYSQ